MAFTDFTASGDGQIDFGANVVVTDLLALVTALPANVVPLAGDPPEFITRVGYFSMGSLNGFSGTALAYWQPPLYLHNMQSVWDFAGGNPTDVQFIRWHFVTGLTLSCRVYH